MPFFGPDLEMLVLAAFEENGVFPLLEGDGEFVLIDAESAVVFIATEDELGVEPVLESVVGSQSQLGGEITFLPWSHSRLSNFRGAKYRLHRLQA